MVQKLKPAILRVKKPTKEELGAIKRNPIYFILDEVTDTYNIGSLFRLADALAVEKVFLCGEMEYPPSSRIHKAAVGTENWVPWEKRDSALEVIRELRKIGIWIVAVEQDKRAISYKNYIPKTPVALVLGNETYGIKKEVLDECDLIVELPMFGVNHSFNVWGSAAVIGYTIVKKTAIAEEGSGQKGSK